MTTVPMKAIITNAGWTSGITTATATMKRVTATITKTALKSPTVPGSALLVMQMKKTKRKLQFTTAHHS